MPRADWVAAWRWEWTESLRVLQVIAVLEATILEEIEVDIDRLLKKRQLNVQEQHALVAHANKLLLSSGGMEKHPRFELHLNG
ncbi:hypothetical protein NLK61_24810 [Pseudomonas fuscovaginae UPB0736]|uniref:hypothetical protein n=1 Tax=Pseudomonas asplenii TaxID=53407 RepID=UPI00028924C4|nr:hypothetical protein [Pseudomonas fuscovaginae]UUQ64400.1 hypothetical protein NLK61_24810 [Pseudomonas fuscovaginae UPB0736]